MKKYTPKENAAYMQGFVKGRQKDDIEWWQVRLAVDAAYVLYKQTVAAKDAEIARLRAEIENTTKEYEKRIIGLESEIEAHKIAWRHRRDE